MLSDSHGTPNAVAQVSATNSNGEDVMPTISASEYKMSQSQKDKQGGYVIALDMDKLKRGETVRAGGSGFGINEDGASYTVNATDRHGVAVCRKEELDQSSINHETENK